MDLHTSAVAKELRDLLQLSIVVDPFYNENCYVLRRRDTDACVVIDPGLQHEKTLQVLDDDKLHCERVLLTHGHGDHVSGVPALRAAHNCPAAIHPDDRWLLEHVRMFPNVPADLPEVVCDEDLCAGSTWRWRDVDISVLHTPGHTGGSVSFVVGQDVFAGDTLFRGSVGRTDLPGGSWDALLFSIERTLFSMPPDTVVYPGHGERTTLAAEMRSNPFVGRRH